MELVWTIPALAAVAGVAVLLVLGRRLGADVDGLRDALERVGDVRTAAVEVRREVDETRAALAALRHRS